MPDAGRCFERDPSHRHGVSLRANIDNIPGRPVKPIRFAPGMSEARKRQARQIAAVKAMREAKPPMTYQMISVTIGLSRRHVIRLWKKVEAAKLRRNRV